MQPINQFRLLNIQFWFMLMRIANQTEYRLGNWINRNSISEIKSLNFRIEMKAKTRMNDGMSEKRNPEWME